VSTAYKTNVVLSRKIWLPSHEQKLKLQFLTIISTSVTPYIKRKNLMHCVSFHAKYPNAEHTYSFFGTK
jgi:hypothetical protein